MTRPTRGAVRAALLVLALGFQAAPAIAQDYPTKPVQIVIPFAAGSSTDTVFRILAPALSERLGQQTLVVNRPGGAATIGMNLVAKAVPDGYTLGVATLSFAANPSFMAGRMPFNTENDFAPVSQVTRTPLVLTVNPGIGARSVRELIALATAKPGSLNYASSGIASSGHLAGALFESMAQVTMTHIPFSGTTSASNVVSGQTQLQIAAVPASLSFIRSGKVLALGVTALKPVATLPGVPTIDQAGLPGFEMYEWSGVLAPAGTPAAIIGRLHQEIAKAATDPVVRTRVEGVGAEVVAGTPGQLAAHLKRELAVWSKVAGSIRAAGGESR